MADAFAKSNLEKINKITKEIDGSSLEAKVAFKELLPENMTNFKLTEITIKLVYEIITKSPPKKSRGNDKLNTFIVKKMPQLTAVFVTHLFNCMARNSVFPKALKISRVIPIRKPKKNKDEL